MSTPSTETREEIRRIVAAMPDKKPAPKLKKKEPTEDEKELKALRSKHTKVMALIAASSSVAALKRALKDMETDDETPEKKKVIDTMDDLEDEDE